MKLNNHNVIIYAFVQYKFKLYGLFNIKYIHIVLLYINSLTFTSFVSFVHTFLPAFVLSFVHTFVPFVFKTELIKHKVTQRITQRFTKDLFQQTGFLVVKNH